MGIVLDLRGDNAATADSSNFFSGDRGCKTIRSAQLLISNSSHGFVKQYSLLSTSSKPDLNQPTR